MLHIDAPLLKGLEVSIDSAYIIQSNLHFEETIKVIFISPICFNSFLFTISLQLLNEVNEAKSEILKHFDESFSEKLTFNSLCKALHVFKDYKRNVSLELQIRTSGPTLFNFCILFFKAHESFLKRWN